MNIKTFITAVMIAGAATTASAFSFENTLTGTYVIDENTALGKFRTQAYEGNMSGYLEFAFTDALDGISYTEVGTEYALENVSFRLWADFDEDLTYQATVAEIEFRF